jgi:AmmeMemoRadiSam system protein B
MNIRAMKLPSGWYPHGAQSARTALATFNLPTPDGAIAVVSPHAGWFFAGNVIGRSLSALTCAADTIIVAGGHLGSNEPVLAATEDALQTPFGSLPIDTELRDAVKIPLQWQADTEIDNSVEVLLPVVHYFWPSGRVLWLRMPASPAAYAVGITLAEHAQQLNRNAVFIASSDLTHYGPTYGFTPKGRGQNALAWVRDTNDKRFIDAVLSNDNDETFRRATLERSACSVGAVLAAMGFCSVKNATHRSLLDYTTSADVMNAKGLDDADSFVGYAGIKMW